MGWFRRPTDAGPALVSVLGKGARSAVGAGALLSSRYVLTCAHVVSLALGKEKENTDRPAASDRLSIVLHDGAVKHPRTARLLVWVPPRPNDGDLAVLELDEPAAPSTRAVAWQDMTEGLKVRARHGGGESIAYADTTIKASDVWYYYADAGLSGASIQEGYSGSPLFRRDDPTVAVGLVTEHVTSPRPLSDRQTVRRTLTVPWQRIRDELARVDAHHVLDVCRHARFTDPGTVPDDVVDLLLRLFDSAERLTYQARRLARNLGYQMLSPEGPGPAAFSLEEELAALLFTEERALATLAELLTDTVRADQRETLNQLLDHGRSVEHVRLLSVDEHQKLLGILRRVNSAHPGLVRQAARETMRYDLRLPDWLRNSDVHLTEGQLAAAVDDLERFGGVPEADDGARPMPRLLRLAVFVSAAVADKRTRKELDVWCEGVRRRLGVDRSLLVDCSEQASKWAKFRPRPVTRIAVGLSPHDSGREGYHCRIWLVREGRAPERMQGPDGPCTAEEVGREIHRVAREYQNSAGQSAPWIDVVIERDDLDVLHVPVDGWTAYSVLDEISSYGIPPPPGLPEESRVLGAEYPVALRLREFDRDPGREYRRRCELRRRWEAGRTASFVIKDANTAALKVMDALKGEYGDVAWVVLHGGPADRDTFLPLCLAMGVPVVLWDREAGSLEHAKRLEDVIGTAALPELPQLIRGFRKDVYHSGKPSPARPAMVWDDPDVPLPPSPDYGDPPDAPMNWKG